jgi:hypothetical protein
LEGISKLTEENGALLVFDEVVTGFHVAYGGARQSPGDASSGRSRLSTENKVIDVVGGECDNGGFILGRGIVECKPVLTALYLPAITSYDY